MVDVMVPLYALLVFMLIAAVIAVETRDLLSSVLCLGALGFGLSLTDILLRAPDLALTQVVVEIFAVVLLIRTVVARQDTTEETLADTPHVAFIGGVIMAVVIAAYVCFQFLAPVGEPLMHMGQAYLTQGHQGARNFVTAVLLDFRAYDTLGEATVIFTAIIGCYALLRTRGKTNHARDDADS
jgi:multisubunit Na+/H+ antiporter MnhB subunit